MTDLERDIIRLGAVRPGVHYSCFEDGTWTAFLEFSGRAPGSALPDKSWRATGATLAEAVANGLADSPTPEISDAELAKAQAAADECGGEPLPKGVSVVAQRHPWAGVPDIAMKLTAYKDGKPILKSGVVEGINGEHAFLLMRQFVQDAGCQAKTLGRCIRNSQLLKDWPTSIAGQKWASEKEARLKALSDLLCPTSLPATVSAT